MARYLHTMYRITDPDRSRAFYETLGMTFRRELPINRDGQHEATNYFFGFDDQPEELELTFNTDGRSYDNGTGYGHIAIGVDDLDATLAGLKEQGIEPERPPYTVSAGGSRLCFVRDPDDYRIELIERSNS
jgi:lactoylglutathione lyase